jgi:hypothetical protein
MAALGLAFRSQILSPWLLSVFWAFLIDRGRRVRNGGQNSEVTLLDHDIMASNSITIPNEIPIREL